MSLQLTVLTFTLLLILFFLSHQGVLDDKDNKEKGKSLFFHETSRSSNYYYDADFQPEYDSHATLSENA